MNVKIKKLSENARIPEYASVGSAGADLYNASGDVTIDAGESVAIGTGIAMQIPEGYVGLVYARSGLANARVMQENYFLPVEPKPPSPRCVESISPSSNEQRINGAITICAMRSPEATVRGSFE